MTEPKLIEDFPSIRLRLAEIEAEKMPVEVTDGKPEEWAGMYNAPDFDPA